jgi:hypothetical protein
MFRVLIKLGKWLESRYPEKLIVTERDYLQLKQDIQLCKALLPQMDTVLQRLSVVETNAVHKGAVSDLITAVKALKDEYVSLKASLGMNRIGDASIRAMLNGMPLEGEE